MKWTILTSSDEVDREDILRRVLREWMNEARSRAAELRKWREAHTCPFCLHCPGETDVHTLLLAVGSPETRY
jgi:hypothetical protein